MIPRIVSDVFENIEKADMHLEFMVKGEMAIISALRSINLILRHFPLHPFNSVVR